MVITGKIQDIMKYIELMIDMFDESASVKSAIEYSQNLWNKI